MPDDATVTITLKRVRLKEFIAGYVKCNSAVMEVNPTLSLMLSHEVTRPFFDSHAPDPTLKIRHLVRLPWTRRDMDFGLENVPFTFPLLGKRLPHDVCLLFVLEVDTTTAMGHPGTKMVGVGSVPLKHLQTMTERKSVDIINRPAVAAGYGRSFSVKGTLHLDEVTVEISRGVEYVSANAMEDTIRDLEHLTDVCNRLTNAYYDTVNGSHPMRKELASMHTPFYASGTIPADPKSSKDVPMIPSSLAFDRRPPSAYQFQPEFVNVLLEAALEQCKLTAADFMDPKTPHTLARCVECAHLVATMLPICEQYGYDDAYDFQSDLGTSVTPWDPVDLNAGDESAPRFSLLAPSSRLVPRHDGPMRIDENEPHTYVREKAEEDAFEAWSRPYVVPTAGRRTYGTMDTSRFGGTDELNVPSMSGGQNIMDCEDGAFYARRLIGAMDHVIEHATSPEQKALFVALRDIYDRYVYARTVNWCHGNVCHILTVGFEKLEFYESIVVGSEVSQMSSTVHRHNGAELEKLSERVIEQIRIERAKHPAVDGMVYPSMVALETTSKAASRLSGVGPEDKRSVLASMGIKLDIIFKDNENIQSQWQITMQTRNIRDQDCMKPFVLKPDKYPLYEFYNYMTVAEIPHDLAFQSDEVAWMSFLVSERYGPKTSDHLTSDGMPQYGASVQRMALRGYTMIPALPVSRRDQSAVNALMRADLPVAFFTGQTSRPSTGVVIDTVTKQPRCDVFIPRSVADGGTRNADTKLRQWFQDKLIDPHSYKLIEKMVPLRFYVTEDLFSTVHLEEFRKGLIRSGPAFYALDYEIISLTRNSESAVDAICGERVSRGDSSLTYTENYTRIYCIMVYYRDICTLTS